MKSKSTRSETSKNKNDTEKQAAAFATLRKLIFECPDDYLVRLFENHTEWELVPDFVSHDLVGSLSMLEQMAALGKRGAIENLAAIGTRIARFLDQMAGISSDQIQKNVDQGKLIRRDEDNNSNLKRDYRDLLKALRTLANAPLGEVRKTIKLIEDHYPTGLMLPDAVGMFTRDLHHILIPGSDDDSEPGATQRPSQAMENLSELDSLLSRLLEYRAQHLARQATREALSNAETWPIAVPALEGGRAKRIERRLEETGLGSGLVYNLKGTPHGRTRKITKAGNSKRAFKIFLKLNSERLRAEEKGSDYRRECGDYEKQQAEPHSSRSTPVEADCRRLLELRKWNSRTDWIRKAALLPTPRIEHLDLWTDTALSFERSVFAEKIYSGPKGKRLIEAAANGSMLAYRLFGVCEESKSKKSQHRIFQARCPSCKASEKQYSEELMLAQACELALYEALEDNVKNEFTPGTIRKALKTNLEVILGRGDESPSA